VIILRISSGLISISAMSSLSMMPQVLALLCAGPLGQSWVVNWLARAHYDRLCLIVHLLKVCGIISADLNCFSRDYTLLLLKLILLKASNYCHSHRLNV